MNKEITSESRFSKLNDWLPLVLITGGLVVGWLNIDTYGILISSGFITYGVLGLIDSIRRKYYKHLYLRLLKVIGLIIIVVLGFYNLFLSGSLIFLLLLILFDRIILTQARLEQE